MLVVQLTGLSGSGKTTLSHKVKELLEQQNLLVELIDGDEYRKTLCKDLDFSKEGRRENIRRLGRFAHLLADVKDVVIIAAINPFEDIRQELREKYGAKTIWINCSVTELTKRDTKGFYKRALLPENHPDKIYNFSGISDNYDLPVDYDLEIRTDIEPIAQSVNKFFSFIFKQLHK